MIPPVMANASLWATLMVACFGLAACGGGPTPTRPAGVPASARWTGNVEGGTWIDCQPVPTVPLRYSCRAYFENTGAVIAEGQYLLRHRSWNQQQLRSEYTEPAPGDLPEFDAFDGRWITLKNDAVLLPDGVISYPGSPGHGKRQQYRLGVESGSAVPY